MLTPAAAAILVALTFVVGIAATSLVRALMRRHGILDRPRAGPDGDRKIHDQPIAYEGGLALYVAFIAGLVAAIALQPAFLLDANRLRAIILGATAVTALGVADDLLGLRPIPKLLAQAAIGLGMWAAGFGIERLSNPFGAAIIPSPAISALGTIFWYALLMNGLNLVDGLDGLAAGITAISSITLAAIALDLNADLALALALIVAAACAGFLPFNFSPATIFMGDAGSLLLGFLLATIALLSSSKAPALLALLIPALAVGLPIFESAFSFLRRAARGQHPFRGDRRHLHHRFLALGFSPRRAVLTFYYLTAYFGVVAYVLQRMESKATLLLVAIIGLGMLVLIENMRFLERRRGVVARDERTPQA